MEEEINRAIFEANTLNALISAYTVITGISIGFVDAMVNKDGLSEAEAKKLIMNIDEAARNKVEEGYREFLKNKEGENE